MGQLSRTDGHEHLNRMSQRIGMFLGKSEGRGKNDFGKNMVEEHISFYMRQGLNREDALVAMKIPKRLKDELGVRNIIDLMGFYKEGDINSFFDRFSLVFSEGRRDDFTGYRLEELLNTLWHYLGGLHTLDDRKTGNRLLLIIDVMKEIGQTLLSREQTIINRKRIVEVLKGLDLFYFENKDLKFTGGQVIEKVSESLK